jgi:hypothetical protein
VSIKIELNTYDYEEMYTYMISIKKDLLGSTTADDNVIRLIGEAIKRLLYIKLSIAVAEEVGEGLEVYSMSDSQ